MSQVKRSDAVRKLWQLGVLTWKLDSNQKQVKDIFESTDGKIVVLASSRQIGKSYTLVVLGIEACLTQKNIIVKFVAPTTKMVRTITKTLMREILEDCPHDLRPRFHAQENTWRFKNGSEMQFAGAESENIESIRGGKAHLVLVDEAGFISDLKYAVNSVLLPTTTTTQGKIILASTPPKSPSHDFIYYMEKAKKENCLITKTIFDNPRLTEKDIDLLAEESGGYDSIDFRREYLVEIITDSERAVMPEFRDELEKEIVVEWPRPAYFNSYVSMDLGFHDFTVVLFAYYDFLKAKVVIEDELVYMNGFTTNDLAKEVKLKEEQLWNGKQPSIRVADNNLIVINDLAKLHNLYFLPTAKDDKSSAVNHARMMLGDKRVIINPKCKTLIYHLRTAIWTKSRKTYDRGGDGSHFDAVDAFVYLIRNINFNDNPYPKGYNIDFNNSFVSQPLENSNANFSNLMKKVFKFNK